LQVLEWWRWPCLMAFCNFDGAELDPLFASEELPYVVARWIGEGGL